MTRQDINHAFLQTSFLDGANAAYVEALQAKYEQRPEFGRAGLARIFEALGDDPRASRRPPRAPRGSARHWPADAQDELTNALDGDWPATEKAVGDKMRAQSRRRAGRRDAERRVVHRATRDSVRALMLIRAYRMRGHLHANLDPLGLEPRKDHEELHPATYGFTEADYDRPIFIDKVLGLEFATLRQMLAILRRTYCGTIGFEFMHISDPAEKAWIQERIEGPRQGDHFTSEGKRAILNKLVEAEGFEKFCDVKYPGTKRFGLDGGESMIPALEQIIKRGGAARRARRSCFGMAHRGRLNVLPRSWASRTAPSSTNSRAARLRPTKSRARATSNITSAPRRTASSTATRSICR